MFECFMFFISVLEMPFIGKEKAFKYQTQNLELFLKMLFRFETIWMRIGQMKSIFLKPPVHLK